MTWICIILFPDNYLFGVDQLRGKKIEEQGERKEKNVGKENEEKRS